MLDTVTATKKSATKKGAKAAEPEGRKKSLLTQAGDEAKRHAERALLLKTLKAHGWNLTHTADALAMGHPSAVLAALDRYDLRAEYDAARAK